MSEHALLWTLGIIAACIAGLFGLLLKHLFDCRANSIKLALIQQTLDNIVREIGTRESGIRGVLHKMANESAGLVERVLNLEERQSESERRTNNR